MSQPARLTPWQRVFQKFGLSQAALAGHLNRHRSKISRELKDEKGLISGRDQELILALARELRVSITAGDLVSSGP